jgi:excisionase family DNA binding protein
MEEEELMTATEAAEYLGISRARVSLLAKQGRLGRQIAGRYNVFTRAELDIYKAQAPQNKGGKGKKSSAGALIAAAPA